MIGHVFSVSHLNRNKIEAMEICFMISEIGRSKLFLNPPSLFLSRFVSGLVRGLGLIKCDSLHKLLHQTIRIETNGI